MELQLTCNETHDKATLRFNEQTTRLDQCQNSLKESDEKRKSCEDSSTSSETCARNLSECESQRTSSEEINEKLKACEAEAESAKQTHEENLSACTSLQNANEDFVKVMNSSLQAETERFQRLESKNNLCVADLAKAKEKTKKAEAGATASANLLSAEKSKFSQLNSTLVRCQRDLQAEVDEVANHRNQTSICQFDLEDVRQKHSNLQSAITTCDFDLKDVSEKERKCKADKKVSLDELAGLKQESTKLKEQADNCAIELTSVKLKVDKCNRKKTLSSKHTNDLRLFFTGQNNETSPTASGYVDYQNDDAVRSGEIIWEGFELNRLDWRAMYAECMAADEDYAKAKMTNCWAMLNTPSTRATVAFGMFILLVLVTVCVFSVACSRMALTRQRRQLDRMKDCYDDLFSEYEALHYKICGMVTLAESFQVNVGGPDLNQMLTEIRSQRPPSFFKQARELTNHTETRPTITNHLPPPTSAPSLLKRALDLIPSTSAPSFFKQTKEPVDQPSTDLQRATTETCPTVAIHLSPTTSAYPSHLNPFD